MSDYGKDEDPCYEDGEDFHGRSGPVYREPLGTAVFKERRHMAHVRYRDTHRNPAETGAARGRGENRSVWVFSEEGDLAEGLFEGALELIMDSRLAPGASIGRHRHDDTEEVYYLLEGSLEIVLVDAEGRETRRRLAPGDAHMIRRGQSHWALAGEQGARLIAVALRV